jgi:hypothetical protein
MTTRVRRAVWFVIIGTVLICLIVSKAAKSSRPPQQQTTFVNYHANVICPDSVTEDLDFSQKNIRYFDLKLHEGCFGGFVHIPHTWHNWENEPIGDQTGFWFAIWIANESTSRGAFFANDNHDFNYNVARFQGHGTMRFYTNIDAPAPTSSESSERQEPQLPQISQLSIHHTDPHICDKPASAYYAETGGRFTGKDPNGGSDGEGPEFLFDSNHFDGKITWANGFKGKVPVCLIVDEQGNPGNIHFPQSPGKEIEGHIREIIMGWHYNGGFIPPVFVPIRIIVDCQIAEMFTFE